MTAAVDEIVMGLPDVDALDGPTSFTNLPAEVWEARPALGHIRTAAHARARSADAVLAFVLARVAAAAPPNYVLPPVVGAAGSLNYCAALIGPPGVGKSSAKRIGVELVPLDHLEGFVDDVPPGSGEGLIDTYFALVDEKGDDGKTRKVKRQTKKSLFLYLDEGQTLAELGGRSGSTLLPTLRTAWTGDTLGQANASEDRRRRLGAGTYRLAFVAGYQAEHAAALIGDAAGGTPQRFAWFSADDPTVPYDPPTWPGPLSWELPELRSYSGLDAPVELTIPDAITTELRRAAVARTRGEEEVDTLDAHRDLSRLKIAGLLAILDGRTDIVTEDWDLSGVVMRTSDAVRGAVIARARALQRAREDEGHRSAGRRELHLDETRADSATRRMARAMARHVHKADCNDGYRLRCVSRATRSTDRHHATTEEAIDMAMAEGWVTIADDVIRPGSARPA